MGWPFYAMNLWQASADGGLVAWLYGATSATAKLAGGAVTLEQITDYPFDDRASIIVTEGEGEFPLYLRIPGWCRSVEVSVNGETRQLSADGEDMVRIERPWGQGDRVEARFDMPMTQTRWPRSGAITVDRGPLSYSVRIDEEWRRCGGTDDWPESEVIPASDWNYGLVLDAGGRVQASVLKTAGELADNPWTLENSPVELAVKARKIAEWKLEPGGSVQELRKSPIRSDADAEEIPMIPLGCARLRMSCLPVVDDTPEANVWGEFRDC